MAGTNLTSPEQVLKALRAEDGVDSDAVQGLFHTGGGINAEQQAKLLWSIRAYSVMLAPALGGLASFPEDSPVGAGQFTGGGAPAPGSVVPGNVSVRTHTTGARTGTYDTAYIGDTITRGTRQVGTSYTVQEGLADSLGSSGELGGNYGNTAVKFGRREFALQKLRSSEKLTTEFLNRNILNGKLNTALEAHLAPRMAHDFEDLAINGDTSIAPATVLPYLNPRNELLSTNDGWVKISLDQSPTVDANGAYIDFEHFAKMIRTLPPEVQQIGFRWWMNPRTWFDWGLNLHTNHFSSDATRDGALNGRFAGPLGLPVTIVPAMPIDRPIAAGASAPGRMLANRADPFWFSPTVVGNQTEDLVLDVSGMSATAATQTLTIPLPTYSHANVENHLLTLDRVVALINAQAAANTRLANDPFDYSQVARRGQHGHLELVLPATGVDLAINGVVNQQMFDELGLVTVDALNTVAKGSAGATTDTFNGSLVWLAQPQNFNWHISTAEQGSDASGLRAFMKFDQAEDAFYTDIYSFQDATIERPDRMVVLKDVAVVRNSDANPF